MIVKEFYRTRKDGVNLYRTYSDEEFISCRMKRAQSMPRQ